MIRPWPAFNWLGRYRWTCIGIVCLCMAVLIAATAVAQAPSDLLKAIPDLPLNPGDEPCRIPSPLHHPCEAGSGEW